MAKHNDSFETESHTTAATGDLYRLYLRGMRRIGHYRWFALVMKHVGTRADRTMIRASRGRLSMSGPALPTMLLRRKEDERASNERFRCITCATARIWLRLAKTSG